MCRATDNHGFYYPTQRDQLKIKAFYLRFTLSSSRKPLPETLTLHYLPRLSGIPLEIDNSKIRPDSDAFVTLHRLISAENQKKKNPSSSSKEAMYVSRERVRVGEAVRFEVYMREEKVLKGIFREDDEEEWRLDCECALARESKCFGVDISEVEVSVAAEGHVAIIEKVDMRRRKKCRRRGFVMGLDEIPEEREDFFIELDGCDCSCCDDDDESGSDGEEDCLELERRKDQEEGDLEMESVKWAVDVGIWVMCLGVGYLVSKTATKRRKTRFLF